jgi:hypothetical protein
MPGRAGLYNASSRESRALKRITRGGAVGSGDDKEALTRSAIGIVSRLSRAAGRGVALPKPKPPCPDVDIGPSSSKSGSGSGTVILIVGVIFAMIALALFLGMRGRTGPRPH